MQDERLDGLKCLGGCKLHALAIPLHAPAKLLILRATNPWAQEVPSSNLGAPTTCGFHLQFSPRLIPSRNRPRLNTPGSAMKLMGSRNRLFSGEMCYFVPLKLLFADF
jgi:hypothetical protein